MRRMLLKLPTDPRPRPLPSAGLRRFPRAGTRRPARAARPRRVRPAAATPARHERNRRRGSHVVPPGDDNEGRLTLDDNVRRAQTESLFRDVNEKIAASAQRFDADSTQFVCECADPNCIHRVEATLNEYEAVREDGATFMLAPGHAHDDIERV